MKRFVLALALVCAVFAVSAASASADPGSNNPKVQYRTFQASDGNTYMGAFVGVGPASFLLVGTTNVFAIRSFTEYTAPGGQVLFSKQYGTQGIDPGTLITGWYTDPKGVYNVFTGFITPR